MSECEWCGVDFEPHPKATVPQRFCSRYCQRTAYYYERRARDSELALDATRPR